MRIRTFIQLIALVFITFIFFGCEKDDTIEIVPGEPTQKGGVYYPDDDWEEVCCEEADRWSAELLDKASDYAQYLKSDAVVIVHKGRIVRKWGEVNRKFGAYSVRKSFLSALYGNYVVDGTIHLDATMEDLGIDDYETENHESLTDTEKQATVKMLLQARSGIYHPAAFETSSMRENRPERGEYAPGEHWWYNNWDFNALGTIFEKETATDIYNAFKIDIAAPIGMQNFTPEIDGIYENDDVSMHKAYTFNMSAMDMARFGLLFARKGRWKDQQVIPELWVEESTAVHSSLQTSGGYGYMWWVARGGKHFSNIDNVPEGLITARGNGGQVIAVIPDMDLVLIHRGNRNRGDDAGVPYRQIGKLLMKVIEAMPQPE